MYYSSFVFQVPRTRPGTYKYRFKERLFKTWKVSLLASLPSLVYHLTLGREKIEVKKLRDDSNYLRNQSGITLRWTGLREKTWIKSFNFWSNFRLNSPKQEFTAPKTFHWFITVYIEKPHINTNILCIRLKNRRKSFPFTHHSSSLALQCFHVQGKRAMFYFIVSI